MSKQLPNLGDLSNLPPGREPPNNDELRKTIRELRKEIMGLREARTPDPHAFQAELSNHNFRDLDSIRQYGRTLKNANEGICTLLAFGLDTQASFLMASASANGSNSATVINIHNQKRTDYIPLGTNYAMSLKVDPFQGRLLGAGGLENVYSIQRFYGNNPPPPDPDWDPLQPKVEAILGDTSAAIFCSEWTDESHVATGIGQGHIILWDVQEQLSVNSVQSHTSDLSDMSLNPAMTNLLVTSGSDYTCRLYDLKDMTKNKGPVWGTVDMNCRDVECVDWFPDGTAFAAGLSNSQVVLYDTRACCKLMTFVDASPSAAGLPCEDAMFSSSGRLLFVRYSHQKVVAFDVTKVSGDNLQPTDEWGTVLTGPVNTAIVATIQDEAKGLPTESLGMSNNRSIMAIGEGSRRNNSSPNTSEDCSARLYSTTRRGR